MSFGSKALQILQTVAPTVALAVGGPFGPLASAAISAALGTPKGDDKAAETALLTATPDQLLALTKENDAFKVQMENLKITEEGLVYADVANARAREVAVKDTTPQILAYGITAGFFGVLGYLVAYGKPQVGGDVVLVLLGSLGTAFTGIIAYYFGSSAGSAAKTDILATVSATAAAKTK
jgi:hypothetical protein